MGGMPDTGDLTAYAMQGLRGLLLVVAGVALLAVAGAGLWFWRFWRTGR